MVARQLVYYTYGSINAKPPFEYPQALTELRDKIAVDPNFAVVESNDVTTAVTVMSPGSKTSPAQLQLLALRDADHRPSQWRPGTRLGPLPLLDGEYPADVTHVAIWPDGIAAQDIHANAPRLGRLSHCLRQLVGAYVTFEPLFQPDMFERLEQLRGQVRGVEISMSRPETADAQDRGAFGMLMPAARGSRAPSVGVRLGVGRYGPRDRYLDDATQDAIFEVAEHAYDQVDTLIVRGRNRTTGKTDEVNFLGERLHVKADIPARADVPALPEESHVFREFDLGYRDFRSQGLFEKAIKAQAMRAR
jgi:hypothetical protein